MVEMEVVSEKENEKKILMMMGQEHFKQRETSRLLESWENLCYNIICTHNDLKPCC